MKDRFLFRGKEIAGEMADEWVYGYFVGANEPVDPHNEIYSPCDWGYKRHVVWPETICQCTGLKDEDGKLIFEGDIIQRQCWKQLERVIVWDCELAAFAMQAVDDETLRHEFDIGEPGVKVIGNIHDKSE